MNFQVLYKVVIMAAIDVVALFGNTLVCLSVYKNPRLKSKIGIVILNLAVTDLLAALLLMPLAAAAIALFSKNGVMESEWIKANKNGPLCYVTAILSYTLAGMSLSLMALAAVIRYLCVVKPNLYRRYITMQSIMVYAATMCFIMLVLQASMLIPQLAEARFISTNALCLITFYEPYKHLEMIMTSLILVLWFGIPVTISFFCYAAVFYTVRKHNRRIHPSTKKPVNHIQSKEKNRKFTRKKVQVSLPIALAELDNRPQGLSKEEDLILKHQNDIPYDNNCDTATEKDREPCSSKTLATVQKHCLEPYQSTQVGRTNDRSHDHADHAHNDVDNNDDGYSHAHNDVNHDNSNDDDNNHAHNDVNHDNSNDGDDNHAHNDVNRDNNNDDDYTHAHNDSKKATCDYSVTNESFQAKEVVSRSNHAQENIPNARVQVTEVKVTKTVLAVFIGFFCCWIPVIIDFGIAQARSPGSYKGEMITFCAALSSAVNPFIYGVADRRFRQTYKKILGCKNI